MNRRNRVLWFGGGGALVVAGVVVGALIHSGLGNLLTIGLIGIGMVAIVSMLFYEVGLTDDRAHEREQREREEAARKAALREARPAKRSGRLSARPLDRMRGRPRRLP